MTTEYLKLTESQAQTVHPGAARRAKFANAALEVRMFNVGQGEAILITFPNRRAWLVDGGSSSSDQNNQKLGKLLATHLQSNTLKLEALVPSHPHKDHVGAVATLLQARPLMTNPLTIYRSADATWDPSTGWIGDLENELARLPSPVKKVTLSNSLTVVPLGDGVEARLFAGSGQGAYTSVFCQLRFHQTRLLFTGDSKCGYERKLLANFGEDNFRADLLKITHHGSSSGTARKLVNAVKPALAIASTADEGGHRLERDTLERVQPAGSLRRVYETGIDGDIILRTDGGAYGGGVLYQVELVAPGLFSTELGATTLPRAEVDPKRGRTEYSDCVGV